MRLSFAQAVELGLVTQEDARIGMRQQLQSARERNRRSGAQRRRYTGNCCPQRLLFDALRKRLGDAEVVWEAKHLIPGRRFRADIYLPVSRLVIEMDGFQYHRSKAAFQKDRLRQNLYVENGFRVLRFFTSQVFAQLDQVIGQIVWTHHAARNRYSLSDLDQGV